MEKGYNFTSAETLINRMEDEQRSTLFGQEEKNLICNYAFHVGDSPKVEQLVQTLAAQQFEIRYGYLDPAVTNKIKAEIFHIDELWAAQAAPPDNYLKAAEIGTEQNLNMVDGIINNTVLEPPCVKAEKDEFLDSRPSVRALLKEYAAQTEAKAAAQEHNKDVPER